MLNFLKKFSDWMIAIIVAVIMVAVVYCYQIGNYGYTTLNLVRYLCDGFFVTAVLYLCFGALVWISNIGGFNGLKYLTYSLVTLFSPRNSRFEERKSYYQFLNEKEKSDKKSSNNVLFVTGGLCLMIAIILSVVFEMFHNVTT